MTNSILKLVTYALDKNLIDPLDGDYAVNQLAYKLKLDPSSFKPQYIKDLSFIDIIEPLLLHAVNIGIIEDNLESKDNFESYLMDTFSMRPSDLAHRFDELNARQATTFFYQLCKDNHYIKTERIDQNIHYSYQSSYGKIQITINLSKPEKDPKTIAKLKTMKSYTYPECLLCKENIGFYGHLSHPGRSNHRAIPMLLNNEPFYFQYSPYVYYNEHAIVFHKDHIPMHISRKTFLRLFDFVDRFPHYFLGSNAGLEIVGGSILNHEHYQGGSAHFPIEDAKSFITYHINHTQVDLLIWPLSVIRLTSSNRDSIIHLADQLRVYYENYCDESVGLITSQTKPHNAITPIVRKKDDVYIVDIALRNNRVSEQYPDGVFHPHQDVHAIKKENIGLIEVMGLAILPGRLSNDLNEIENCLTNHLALPEDLSVYKDWVKRLEINSDLSIKDNIKNAVAITFIKGLEDCGIFKQNDYGKERFKAFINGFISSLDKPMKNIH